MVFLCVPHHMRRWQDGALIDEDTFKARAGLISARWPGSVFLATAEAICGGHPVEAQYGALRQKLLLVAICVILQHIVAKFSAICFTKRAAQYTSQRGFELKWGPLTI
jgi:hypothetical protein